MIRLNLAYAVAPTTHLSHLESEINDAALVRKAQAGDTVSLEILLCKHWADFCRRAIKAFDGRTGTQDIRQRACLKAIDSLDRFVAGRSFRAWVFAFIDNEAKTFRRNLKIVCTRTQQIDIHIIETMSAGAENRSEADEREILILLSKRARQLAKPQQASAIFMLSHYERLREFPTVRAIAQATRSSQGAAQLNRKAILASWRHILTGSEFEIHSQNE